EGAGRPDPDGLLRGPDPDSHRCPDRPAARDRQIALPARLRPPQACAGGGPVVSRYHPSSDILMAYAAGSLPEPHALLVATHLSLCPACREQAAELDAVGGALLDRLAPAEIASDALERMLARLDEPAPPPAPAVPADPVLPAPLRAYVGRSIEGIAWKKLGRGIEEFRLPIPN